MYDIFATEGIVVIQKAILMKGLNTALVLLQQEHKGRPC